MAVSSRVPKDSLSPGRSTMTELGSAPQGRPRRNGEMIETAKTTASNALKVLNVVAEMAENVPYLGAISKALTAFNAVLEEVEVCQKDCRAAANEAAEFVDSIHKFEAKTAPVDGGQDDELRKALIALGSVMKDCLEILQALGVDSKRRRDRVKLFLKRGDVLSSVNECRDKMRIAKEKFSIAVNADTNRVAHEIRSHLLPRTTAASTEMIWPFHAANAIFFGRESEVERAVGLFMSQVPARVAVLGPGGIGKTSIARAILHDPKMAEIYGDRRCFMTCEACTTSDSVVRKLADALGVRIDTAFSTESARHNLLLYLESVTGIICLDNLETPWDADTAAMEDFLAELSHLPSIALLITSRVTDTPLIGWSNPRLAPIAPFTLEAALQTWDSICGGDDEYSVKLVRVVDCVPLAVTLLARLARTETARSLWARWERERTDLVRSRGAGHRLNNIGVSIETSLQSLQSQDAIDVLSILCVSDYGLEQDELSKLEDIMRDRVAVRRSVTLLIQLSLAYIDDQRDSRLRFLCVLSPIRHHMQQHHRILDETFLLFVDIVPDLRSWHRDYYLQLGIDRGGSCEKRCLRIVAADPDRCNDPKVLSRATEMSREFDLHVQSRLHRRYGSIMKFYDSKKARSILSMAVELDEELDDQDALFEDWTCWFATLLYDFDGPEKDLSDLDEVQEVIQKAWDICHKKEEQAWNRDFHIYAVILAGIQHSINRGRRKLCAPVVYRSGLFSDSKSEIRVEQDSIWTVGASHMPERLPERPEIDFSDFPDSEIWGICKAGHA